MKNINNQKKKYLLLSFCIVISMIFPGAFNFLNTDNIDENVIDAPNAPDSSENQFIYSINGDDYLAEYLTEEDVEKMKSTLEASQERSHSESNLIIDGHGTGYTCPSPEALDSLIGTVSLLKVIPKFGQGYRATADLSTEIYFPAVGDQGMQGSCSAWANAYYAYGYLEAKDYGWTASSGNPDYLLSPAWAYNKVAAYDYGSIPYEIVQALIDWGVPTLSAMPYDDTDVDSWGDEVAWRQAPYHRPLDYTLVSYTGSDTINLIKSLLSSGIPFTIGIDAYQFNNGLNQGTGDFILSSDEYDSISLNHAQCFVGYDDDITEGSDVGAFRVVNSWGDTWMDNGYYWLTYDAFAEFAGIGGQVLMYITDRIDYNPDLIATWEFSDAPTRMDDIITLGVGPHDSPFDTKKPLYDNDINNVFPDFMALDISEFYPYYTIDNDVFFFLEIGPSDTTGTISSFRLERYSGGILQEISDESINIPENTPGYVNATFKQYPHELLVKLEVPKNPVIDNTYTIIATLINVGTSDETNIDFFFYLDGITIGSINLLSLTSKANYTLDYIWTPTVSDAYNFTALTPLIPGEEYAFNNIATQILCVLKPIFQDDFESGLSNWTSITGMWHLTGSESAWSDPYHSPTHSMWFGNETTGTYESPNREMGNLTSLPIDLVEIDYALLEFYHWREAEGNNWDNSYVYVSVDGINWDEVYFNSYNFISPWSKVSIDLSKYTGNPSVQIRFYFDTLDSTINNYRGWLVDDVVVLGRFLSHDLKVSLETPLSKKINETYVINATVINNGQNDENNVEIFLYLDGILINSTIIPSLTIGLEYTIQYTWTPTDYGLYDFTALSPAVPLEIYLENNIRTEIVHLFETELFDGLYIKHIFSQNPYLYNTNFTYTPLSGDFFEESFGLEYQGTRMIYDWIVNALTREMSGGSMFEDGAHTPAWIFTNTSLYDTIPIAVDGEGDHLFNVTREFLYDLPGFGLIEVWELEDLTDLGGIAWYEKSTGLLLDGTFLYYGGTYRYDFDFIGTNTPFEYIVFDHDLKVTLETPQSNKIDETYVINATVKNRGLNDETNVELFLYLDGVPINSTIIPTLTVGGEYTIQYVWTPITYGSYNFTARAPAVPLETYLENNMQTDIVYLFETELFDGLYIKYVYTEFYTIFNTTFTYTPLTGRLYEESWILDQMGMIMTYNWIVDALTREMSGGSVFGDGAHTPAWIFTNTSLYDTIPIAVDGEGDHLFNVTKELIYDLPGFGPVEIWELEDLDQSGGIAWYEKSTGILLNGTFLYYGGLNYYTFNFIDTNAKLNILAPPGDFSLSSNAGNPDNDGNFTLTWTASSGANNYSVYVHLSYITEINGSLTILATEITDLSLEQFLYEDGTYYFVVVAHNDLGETLSNCLDITVERLPGDFVLSSNAGDPDDNGNFTLTWTASLWANNYSVYVHSSYITEINGSLTLLASEITDLSLEQFLYEDGTYFFVVVAHNDAGDTLSNCLEIKVEIPGPPGNFTLSSNAGDPDGDGNFILTWTASLWANNYSVYVHSSYITEINVSLTLLASEITDLSFVLSDVPDGEYYFIVVAHNDQGDTLSNCIKTTVESGKIPGYDLVIIIATMGIIGVITIVLKKKKLNRS